MKPLIEWMQKEQMRQFVLKIYEERELSDEARDLLLEHIDSSPTKETEK